MPLLCFSSEDLIIHRLSVRLISAVTQLLGTAHDGVRLTQSDLWGKRGNHDTTYTKYCNSNQRIHCDYPNHTLAMPPSWDRPEVVSIIVYYDDSSSVGGETRVIPRLGADDPAYNIFNGQRTLLLTPGARTDMLWVNDRDHAEAYLQEQAPDVYEFRRDHLYPRECKAGFTVGSVLFYRHDLWHRCVYILQPYCFVTLHFCRIIRGAPVLPGATRRSHNIVYRRKECEWVNNWSSGVARRMYEQNQVWNHHFYLYLGLVYYDF